MIPGFTYLDLYLFAAAVIIVAVVGIIKQDLFNKLSTRITTLILAAGLITFFLIPVSNKFTPTVDNMWLPLGVHLSIVLGVAAMLGLLAARFVRQPLRQFNDAVASLEKNDYKVQLQLTGISEFDEVVLRFNDLSRRLQHEEKLRKDLVSDTSHELNTPLTTMIGQLTAMQEGKLPVTEERLTILKQQAERLADLVRQLDAYTKARMPDSHESENVAIKELSKQLISHFSDDLKQKGIHATLHIADGLIIKANRDALQRILTNFIQNTLRYSQATELAITVTADALTFTDNGKGVPEESLPHLFERFYRVDKSRNRTTGGLGLGLAIIKELVEQQGWRIQAEHANPGITFVVTLHEKD